MKYPPDDENNEPYFGHPMVVNLDKMIVVALEKFEEFSPIAQNGPFLQFHRVIIDIVPDGISLCCATRSLVKAGYLTAGFVLQRSIWERATTLQYLQENRDKILLWEQGWPHRSRPRLLEMMSKNSADDGKVDSLKKLIDEWNSIVHGDPKSPDILSTFVSKGIRGRSASRQINDWQRAGEVCAFAAGALVIFISMMSIELEQH
jgi:hypothetical protein